jgi:GTP-binding protein Era
MAFRAGIVAVVGRPNVGKSSLVNALVGQKVAIVSDKPQTTRFPVRGVLDGPDFQLVFTDTPGFHKPRTLLGERLNARVGDATSDVDVVLQVVDGAAGVGRGDAFVAERHVRSHSGPKVCALNKIDRLRHPEVVRQLLAAAEVAAFDEIVPISALTGKGLDELRDVLVRLVPEGEPLFPVGEVTDTPLEIRIAELVREKALAMAREEVPHSVAVLVEELRRDDAKGLVHISCTIFVERDSQKGILIGAGGRTLKEIGTQARLELEPLVGARVFLELRVKVQREWQRDPIAMQRLGL